MRNLLFRKTVSLFLLAVMLISLAGLTSCGGQEPPAGLPAGPDPEEQSGPAPGTDDEPDPLPEVVFSRESVITPEESILLELSAPDGCTVYYTTDGSIPDADATVYEGPIEITGSGNNWLTPETIDAMLLEKYYKLYETPEIPDAWVIRAVAVDADGNAGEVVTHTYLPGSDLREKLGDVLILSIASDPDGLLDYENGIMVKGKWYDEWLQQEGSAEVVENGEYWWIEGNYSGKGKEWERPVSVEFFDGGATPSLSVNCGLRIHGGISRTNPHKSLRLNFKKDYGPKVLEYDLFGEKGVYKSLVLRNGGNTAQYMIYKDGWLQSLVGGMGFSTQKIRPAVVFLNGEYWGVYALNDRYDDRYIEEQFGVEDFLVVKDGELQEGENEDMVLYDELLAFADTDLTDESNWKRFTDIMDVDGMAAYYAVEVYIANRDFSPIKNIELWRSLSVSDDNPYADGRWRFMLYDTEYSSNMYYQDFTRPNYDTLSDVLENDPLFLSAFRNSTFRTLFLDKLREIGSERFKPDLVAETLEEWRVRWLPLMEEHNARFATLDETMGDMTYAINDFFANRYNLFIPIAEKIAASFDE